MARDWRMEYKGGFYHVIARGNNKEYIFKNDVDKDYLIKQIKEYKEGMGFRIYGYVLMDNHYHFIIQTMDKKLQEIMHGINNKYSKYFNNKYKRVGHVFQSRYKAILIQDERYLISLIRYLHRNPIRAKMCEKVENYEWSSDVFYRKNIAGFIEINIILEMLSQDRAQAIKLYREYMELEEDEEVKKYEENKIIGDEPYQIMMSTRKHEIERMRLDEILASTGVSMEEFTLIKSGSRKRSLTKYKYEYIKNAIALKYTHREIGENINITDASVRGIFTKYTRIE
ncbi:MAG: transposase [Lutispora sp.]|nr:transposase [Lutispora sp.]